MSLALFFVYLSGVVSGISFFLGAIILGCLFAAVGCTIISLVGAESGDTEAAGKFWKFAQRYFLAGVAVGVLNSFIPERTFMYIAAGLVAGQEVAQTEIAQKAFTLLERRLEEALAPETDTQE